MVTTTPRASRVVCSPRYDFGDIVGESPALHAAIRIARSASSNDLPVLLRGESGVGKEVFAQAIHAASTRADGPFVAINCAALPRELLESELFGYAPGSFTGGRREGNIGKFEAAHRGTLFLDEIGELSQGAQAALLRVLQEGEVTRVGEARARPVDVRVIAATQSASRNDSLRPDVHYRLAVLVCDVPPLRMRSGDVPMLVERFMADAQRELRRGPFSLGSGVVSTLAQHDWPGNVRELKNLIRRLVALASDGVIAVKDLPADVRGLDRHVDAPPSCCRCGFPVGDVSVQQEGPAARKTRSVARADEHADAPIVERTGDEARFLAALAGARSASDAARALGIARSTFYRRLKRHGVEVRHSFQSAATDETNVGHDDDEPTDVAPPSSVSAHHDDS